MKVQDAKDDQVTIPPSAIAEAGVWLARLNDDGNNHALKDGLRKWLAADPVNGHAFEAANDAWELAQKLRRVMPIPRKTSRNLRASFHRGSWIAVAASAAVLAVGAYLYMQRGVYSTKVGERLMYTLDDGSEITLNTATSLKVDLDKTGRRVELSKGEALFNVAKDSTRPFTVTAGSRTITALGTSFVVRSEPERLAVTLIDGKVSVSSGPGSESAINDQGHAAMPVAVLSAGDRIVLAAHKPFKVDRPELESVTAWRRGQVVLDKTPLASAIEEMNRYSATKLRCEEGEACSELVVNGLFQAGDSEKFANVIAAAYGLQVERSDGHILLSGRVHPAPGVRRQP